MSEEKPWHEDERFWQTLEPWLFHPERWEKAAQEVDAMLGLLEPTEGAAVLDLCCGPGRHSLELARRGFRVTGVDRSADYLSEARRRAADEGVEVEFVEADMREFARPGAFDAAVNMFGSFGYFRDAEDDLAVLRSLRRSLRDGGRLLIEMMGKEVLAGKFRERDWSERDGVILLEERALRDDWSRVESRWIVVDGADRREFTLELRLYSAAELRRALRECGFREVSFLRSLDGSPYDQDARRLVALATA